MMTLGKWLERSRKRRIPERRAMAGPHGHLIRWAGPGIPHDWSRRSLGRFEFIPRAAFVRAGIGPAGTHRPWAGGGRVWAGRALAQYEEGVKLLKQCHGLLAFAERRIELLSGVDADGNPVVQPFDDAATFTPEEKTPSRGRRAPHRVQRAARPPILRRTRSAWTLPGASFRIMIRTHSAETLSTSRATRPCRVVEQGPDSPPLAVEDGTFFEEEQLVRRPP